MRRRDRDVLPLVDRLAALREAVEVAEGRLDVPDVARARTLLAKAGAREALGDATVVALAGATGSGKSTMFNTLSGAEVSTPGVRRPTTGVAHASVWGEAGADRLLDWLEVPRRHRVTDGEPALDGLVLLDLPDHDSVRLEHRLEVDRLVELVDVLVWVLDPQKYADAAVHGRYLAPMAGHSGVLVVVLNQIDRLDEQAAAACLADLRGLLDSEGLADTPIVATSARTGAGLMELRGELGRRVSARKAATERLTADVRSTAEALSAHCPDGDPGAGSARAAEAELTGALAGAAGVPVVVAAVERSAVREGTARTGWPPVRWVRKLRPDPLERLHLGDERARSSLPTAGAVQQAGMTAALRQVRTAAGEGPPTRRAPGWPTSSTAPSPVPTSGRRGCRCGSGRSVGCSGRCWPVRSSARCGSSPSSSSAGCSWTTWCPCRRWRASRCPPCSWCWGCSPARCWRCWPGPSCARVPVGDDAGRSSGCTHGSPRWPARRCSRRWRARSRTRASSAPPSAAPAADSPSPSAGKSAFRRPREGVEPRARVAAC